MIPAGTGMKRYNNIDVFREQYGDLDRDMEDPEVASLEEGTGGFSAFSVDREQNTIAVEVTDRKDLERDLDEEDFPDDEDEEIEEEKE
jgi:DNA-directed RNA polymerase subunit beta'